MLLDFKAWVPQSQTAMDPQPVHAEEFLQTWPSGSSITIESNIGINPLMRVAAKKT